MIELEGIEKTYSSGDVSTPVLKGVSFGIGPGEYVAPWVRPARASPR